MEDQNHLIDAMPNTNEDSLLLSLQTERAGSNSRPGTSTADKSTR